MYNYFYLVSERGGKKVYATVYRAPLAYTPFSDNAEHYKGRGKWGLACRRDPSSPTSSHRYENKGAKRFKTERAADSFMRYAAKRERTLYANRPQRRVRYLTCQSCGQAKRIRKDGRFPVHRVPQSHSHCFGSESQP